MEEKQNLSFSLPNVDIELEGKCGSTSEKKGTLIDLNEIFVELVEFIQDSG